MISLSSLGTTPDGAVMVLDLLEKKGGLAPVVGHRGPYFRPPIPPALQAVVSNAMTPTLNWRREIAEGTPLTDIDAIAAFISAGSSAQFAHGALENLGAYDGDVLPGYYLVDAYHWGFGAPGSPLGAADVSGRVWVTAPTYRLLRDLTVGASWTPPGHWPDDKVYDCWVSTSACRLTTWTNVIRDLRRRCIEEGDERGYEALKFGYSQAIQMLETKPDPKGTAPEKRRKKNYAYRPDWAQTIRAQNAANMWRRAWIATLAGHPPVAVGGPDHTTDGMAFVTSDLTAVLAMNKSPFRLDPTRAALGTFYQSRRYFAGEDELDD